MEVPERGICPLNSAETPSEVLDDPPVTIHTATVSEAAEPESAIDAVARAFHGLINSASVIIGGAETLQASWPRMTDGQRDLVIEMVLEQSRTVKRLLGDLCDHPPDELHAAIEHYAGTEDNLSAARRAAADLLP